MPTYEYECRKCGERFERFQSITEKPLKRCPSCRGAVRRLLGTGAGIIFKGSGFYETDYRSRSYKEAAKKEQGEAGSGAAKPKESAGDKAKPASGTAKASG
jgi:putative FmdB family regulatory protein